jgi:flagellar hook-associated protein 3 FlgL
MRNQSRWQCPETNLFKILDTAIAALNTPIADDQTAADALTAIDKANRGLSNSLNNVLTVVDLGTKLNELENWIRWAMTVRWARPSR